MYVGTGTGYLKYNKQKTGGKKISRHLKSHCKTVTDPDPESDPDPVIQCTYPRIRVPVSKVTDSGPLGPSISRLLAECSLSLYLSNSTRQAHLLHQLLLGVGHAGREHGLHVHLGLVQPGRLQPRVGNNPVFFGFLQGFGSGSGLDPYSIGPVDPDPYSESGSGSRRAKITHKSRKNSCFEVLDGLFCELQASYVTWTYFLEAQG